MMRKGVCSFINNMLRCTSSCDDI